MWRHVSFRRRVMELENYERFWRVRRSILTKGLNEFRHGGLRSGFHTNNWPKAACVDRPGRLDWFQEQGDPRTLRFAAPLQPPKSWTSRQPLPAMLKVLASWFHRFQVVRRQCRSWHRTSLKRDLPTSVVGVRADISRSRSNGANDPETTRAAQFCVMHNTAFFNMW
jgi:hypothetical protein